MRQDIYFPGRRRDPEIEDRKKLFAALCEFVSARGGWLTSIPGSREVTMECRPDSSLPDDLRSNGYVVDEIGEGQRMITVGNGHIIKMKRYAFDLP